MAKSINTFDDDSVRLIAHEVQRLRNTTYNLAADMRALKGSPHTSSRVIFGKTTTNTDHPTYPTSGCKFVVQRTDVDWDNGTLDECDAGQTTSIGQYVVGRTLDESFLEEDTEVLCFPVPGSHGGRWYIMSTASAGVLKIGVLTGNVAHGAIGTLRLHDQTGTSLPVERSPIVDLSVLNITGTTMKAGPWMYGEFIEAFDQWIVHPAMIEGCLTPEFDPNNDAANGGAVTASVGENVRYDPDGASGAVTITFPESTTLQDGETFRTENWNQTSTTGITLQANSSSPLDKIEDPSDRTAAYASSHAGVVTTRYVVDWALDTNNYGNPTWKVASLLDS